MEIKKVDFTRLASIVVCFFGIGAALYFAFSYALPIVLPFFIAWAVSVCVAPISRHLSKKTKISERVLCFVIMLIVLALVGVLLFLMFSRILYELQNFVAWASEESGVLEFYIERTGAFFEELVSKLPFSEKIFGYGGIFSAWDTVNDMLSELVSESIKKAGATIPAVMLNMLRALPEFFLFIVVSVIASFYFCLWKDKVGEVFVAFLPERYAKKIPEIKKSVAGAALGYFKAYFLIFLMTFFELLVGFAILGVKYSFILAFFIAIVDILPVLGTGIVLVPWAAVLLLSKNYYLGFGILIVYAVVLLIRQIAEPKIVGKSIGLPPLVTLFAMYAGFKLFGLVGMIVGPTVALIIKGIRTA